MIPLFRFLFRAIWFLFSQLGFMVDYFCVAARHHWNPPLRERTIWMQRCARKTLRILNARFHVEGPPPASGLIVSNHMSYVDILVFSSTLPVVFVAKAELRHWPIFGRIARLGGTLFLQRERRSDVGRIAGEMREVLEAGQVLVLFPEGTSSDGHQVLPFRSSLFEPVLATGHPVHAACIDYTLADGSVEQDICYWGKMTLLPHLAKLMTRNGIVARVRYSGVQPQSADRKGLARELHVEVTRLKDSITTKNRGGVGSAVTRR